MSLYKEVAGDGPALVLIHAGICDSRMWDPQWATFPRDHRTPGPFAHARDLAALLDGLGVERAALVAASYGGQVALELAVARPDLVGLLVLAGASLPGHDWSAAVRDFFAEEEAALERGDLDAAVEANLRTWVDGSGRAPGTVDPAVREAVGQMQRRAFELQLHFAENDEEEDLVPDWPDRIGKLQVPALMLVSDHDQPDIHTIAARLARELPQARTATISGAAHLPSMERPAAFDELVLAFLAEHQRR